MVVGKGCRGGQSSLEDGGGGDGVRGIYSYRSNGCSCGSGGTGTVIWLDLCCASIALLLSVCEQLSGCQCCGVVSSG